MKILVTGAGGFIGRNLIKSLHDDDLILLSSSMIPGYKIINPCGYVFSSDYLMNEGCEDVEAIIHVGAFIPKTISESNDLLLTTKNIFSTQNLLLSSLPSLKKFIYISSIDVYGKTEGIIDEKTFANPITLYGCSKLYCENMVKAFFGGTEVDFQILRIGHVYGEGEEKYKKVIPTMIRKALQNEDIMISGDGQSTRSFIYISDVVKAIINSLYITGNNLMNVVGERAISLNEVAGTIVRLTKSKSIIIHEPTELTNSHSEFDNSRLINSILPEYHSFEEGLMKEIEYFKGLIS